MSELPQGGDEIAKWCHDAFQIKVLLKIYDTNIVLTNICTDTSWLIEVINLFYLTGRSAG